MRFKFLFELRDIIIIDLKCEHYWKLKPICLHWLKCLNEELSNCLWLGVEYWENYVILLRVNLENHGTRWTAENLTRELTTCKGKKQRGDEGVVLLKTNSDFRVKSVTVYTYTNPNISPIA